MSYLRVWREVAHHLELLDEFTQAKSNYSQLQQQVGTLGEIVACEYLGELGFKPKWDNTINHDITIFNGLTIDVKTTSNAGTPTGKHTHKINPEQKKFQHPDFYLFVSLGIKPGTYTSTDVSRFTGANIMGVLGYGELHKVARPVHRDASYYVQGHKPSNIPMIEITYDQLLPTTLLGVAK